jgi:rhamnulokinase
MTPAYISSGTWSLLGVELDRPILSEEARLAGFTNEGGAAGNYRFLTNIMGLWILQECRRAWARQGHTWSYEQIAEMARSAPSPAVVIDVNDPAFFHPHDMSQAIEEHLRATGQPGVTDPGGVTRAVLEGLAIAYREALADIERLAGVRIDTLHIVGGGSRNDLLCRLAADACGRRVVAGPAEATALGNVLVQLVGLGELRDLLEARDVARASSDLRIYEPHPDGRWEEWSTRLRNMRAATSAARA